MNVDLEQRWSVDGNGRLVFVLGIVRKICTSKGLESVEAQAHYVCEVIFSSVHGVWM